MAHLTHRTRSAASLDDDGDGIPFSQAMHASLGDPLGLAASRNGFEADPEWDGGGGWTRRRGKVSVAGGPAKCARRRRLRGGGGSLGCRGACGAVCAACGAC